eukprot:m.1507843 g.1507843  ORF g.1507843 m.1507843 type:complete len:192 (-) comp25209_c0_seq134:1401-1976(-)
MLVTMATSHIYKTHEDTACTATHSVARIQRSGHEHVCVVACIVQHRRHALTSCTRTTNRARWSAPEVLEQRKFSEASDVWSYGIVCVEVFQCGDTPYPGWPHNRVIVQVLQGGVVHPRPPFCPPTVYHRIIQPCLNSDASLRPRFSDLVRDVATLIDNDGMHCNLSTFVEPSALGQKSTSLSPPPRPIYED